MVVPPHREYQDESNITAYIIFNLAHLGISITDTKYFDIETYFELIQLEMNSLNSKDTTKKATQADIDKFFL